MGSVTPFGGGENKDPRENMTEEEIREWEKKEEAQLNGMINKFMKNNSQPDTSSITEEEDDEEETFTLDFENGTVTQNLGEGIVQRNEDGSYEEVVDPELEQKVKKVIAEQAEPLKPTKQQVFQDYISDGMVEKAIASLVKKLADASFEIEKHTYQELKNTPIAGLVGEKTSLMIEEKRNELKKAIRGGNVHYDDIPDWADQYVKEYLNNMLFEIMQFGERD